MTKYKIKPYNIIFAVLAITIMAVIFRLSSENGGESTSTSEQFFKFIVGLFNSDYREGRLPLDEMYKIDSFIQSVMIYVRKLAHFTAYAMLSFCTNYALLFTTVKKSAFCTLIICLLYAISDEIHQLFVPDRSGRVFDVFVDFSGSIAGLLLSLLIIKIVVKIKDKRKGKLA